MYQNIRKLRKIVVVVWAHVLFKCPQGPTGLRAFLSAFKAFGPKCPLSALQALFNTYLDIGVV